MKIKSLLLGSAAAMVAATGAKAADAIVIAEPEPVEYVRVCDAYGAGFFYIPGTETCLSINGYIWAQIGASNQNRIDYIAYEPPADNETGFNPEFLVERRTSNYPVWSSRVRLNFDTRSDTEWGTLRGYLRVQADWNAQNQTIGTGAIGIVSGDPVLITFPGTTAHIPGDGAAYIDQAFLQLGGFQAGYTESAWVVTQYGGVSNWGSHSWDGMKYGSQQRQAIMYGFTSNGFHATLSLEDDGNANWMPDIVGVAGYNAGWGGVWAKAAYDEDRHNGTGPFGVGLFPLHPLAESGSSGWAASIGAQINVPNMPGSSLRLIGFYSDKANAYSVGSKWSVLASYRHQFSSSLAASVAVQYFNDTNYNLAGGDNRWDAELSVVWLPVTNFEVRTEIKHSKPDNVDGTTSGFLRFTRYF